MSTSQSGDFEAGADGAPWVSPTWLQTAIDKSQPDDLLTLTLTRAQMSNVLGALQQECDRVGSRANPNGMVTEVEQHGVLKSLLATMFHIMDEVADPADWVEQDSSLSRWRTEQVEAPDFPAHRWTMRVPGVERCANCGFRPEEATTTICPMSPQASVSQPSQAGAIAGGES